MQYMMKEQAGGKIEYSLRIPRAALSALLVFAAAVLMTSAGSGADGTVFGIPYTGITMRYAVIYSVMLAAAALFVLLMGFRWKDSGDPYEENQHPHPQMWLLTAMFLATPVTLFVISNRVNGRGFVRALTEAGTFAGLLNLAIIALMCLLVYAVTGRMRLTILIVTLFNLAFILVNYFLIMFRGDPLLANDVLEVGTALQVAGNYSFVLDRTSVSAVVLSVIWSAAALALAESWKMKASQRIAVIAIAAIVTAFSYNTIFNGDTLKEHNLKVSGWEPRKSYVENGYHISFLITFIQSRIAKPDGYSAANVRALAEKYPSDSPDKVTETTEKTPNVISVMVESFADLERLGEIKTDEEITPFTNSLKENTISGTMHSSIYGAHTAVSEFEFLTGNSQRFLPLNSIPYTSIIRKDPVASIAWTYKQRGYGGITALHPGRLSSYNRVNAYPLLGFNDFVSQKDMKGVKRIRKFISDEADYERVIAEYEKYRSTEKKKPWYMFNVTIQNHGGYTDDTGEIRPHQINVLDKKLVDEEVSNYLDLVKISDQQIEKLVTYFSNVDEPTVIVLFGDHQPRLPDSFYKVLAKRHGKMSKLLYHERKYRVPFFIWANFDIEEESGVEISANYLGAYLLKKTGSPMTGFQKYLFDLYKELPVTSNIATMDNDGKLYRPDAETPYDDILNEYAQIQYNQLADKKHTVDEFFKLAE